MYSVDLQMMDLESISIVFTELQASDFPWCSSRCDTIFYHLTVQLSAQDASFQHFQVFRIILSNVLLWQLVAFMTLNMKKHSRKNIKLLLK